MKTQESSQLPKPVLSDSTSFLRYDFLIERSFLKWTVPLKVDFLCPAFYTFSAAGVHEEEPFLHHPQVVNFPSPLWGCSVLVGLGRKGDIRNKP